MTVIESDRQRLEKNSHNATFESPQRSNFSLTGPTLAISALVAIAVLYRDNSTNETTISTNLFSLARARFARLVPIASGLLGLTILQQFRSAQAKVFTSVNNNAALSEQLTRAQVEKNKALSTTITSVQSSVPRNTEIETQLTLANADLQSKLEENERLNIQIEDQSEKIQSLNSELERCRKLLTQLLGQEVIDGLPEEEPQVAELEEEVQSTKSSPWTPTPSPTPSPAKFPSTPERSPAANHNGNEHMSTPLSVAEKRKRTPLGRSPAANHNGNERMSTTLNIVEQHNEPTSRFSPSTALEFLKKHRIIMPLTGA